ncbi:hypothetical protein AYO44_07250 [Planctomycetaceae bacterium SCGC AG-212-F19]|nr:hypothetical protein AYO44_07250 [Planctomycetaceae bacterium SCGC AG-212-F19]
MNRLLLCVLVGNLIAAVGCGQNANKAFDTVGSQIGHGGAPAAPAKTTRDAAMESAVADARKPEPAAGQPAAQAPPSEVNLPRKVIYTVNLQLIVDDFDKAHKSLELLVKEQSLKGAFIGRADVNGSAGARRHGSWTIRVPSEFLRDFLDSVAILGDIQRSTLESKDITEEYYDVEARVKNKRIEEDRLLGHLKSSTGRLDEILTVEREINRVRGEAEQLQGRLNVLAHLAALSTVQIQITERKDYVPVAAANFGSTLGQTWTGSINALTTFGQGVLLVVVASAPWVVVFGLVFGPILLLLRRRKRAARSRDSIPVAGPEGLGHAEAV